MLTYICYLIFGSIAVLSANVTWLTTVWFSLIVIDWSASIYNRKTKMMKCNACGESDGIRWVKKEKNDGI